MVCEPERVSTLAVLPGTPCGRVQDSVIEYGIVLQKLPRLLNARFGHEPGLSPPEGGFL